MKNVLSTGITSSSQQPYTKTTHEWYNEMSKDVAEAFVKSLIPSSAYTGKLVILSGCALTGSNPDVRTVSDGWIWYNGEIFRVVAGTFTTTLSEIGVWSINTASTNLIFSDGANKPVHQEKTFVITNGAIGSGLFDENSANVISLGTGYTVKSTVPNLKKTIIDIGTWDMESVSSKGVAHGLTASQIRSVSVLILDDTFFTSQMLINSESLTGTSGASSTLVKVTGTEIVMSRATDGEFDSTLYNSTSANRGYITIEYIE